MGGGRPTRRRARHLAGGCLSRPVGRCDRSRDHGTLHRSSIGTLRDVARSNDRFLKRRRTRRAAYSTRTRSVWPAAWLTRKSPQNFPSPTTPSSFMLPPSSANWARPRARKRSPSEYAAASFFFSVNFGTRAASVGRPIPLCEQSAEFSFLPRG